MDKIARDKIETLEGMVKVLQQELLKHVASAHCLSGEQFEKVAELKKKLNL